MFLEIHINCIEVHSSHIPHDQNSVKKQVVTTEGKVKIGIITYQRCTQSDFPEIHMLPHHRAITSAQRTGKIGATRRTRTCALSNSFAEMPPPGGSPGQSGRESKWDFHIHLAPGHGKGQGVKGLVSSVDVYLSVRLFVTRNLPTVGVEVW